MRRTFYSADGEYLVSIISRDLRGFDLSFLENDQNYLADLQGCIRDESDPPIRGLMRSEDGTMVRPCGYCGANLPGEDCDRGHCDSCCEDNHSACGQCDRHGRIDSCSHCDGCSDCCECRSCANCGDNCNEDYCGDCENCDSCCDCFETRTVRSRPWAREKHHAFAIARTCGVEWEFNDALDASRWADKWGGGLHTDGSCGYEAVTPPLAGDHIAKCIGELGRAIHDSEINDSCGVHVHVDARDFRWSDMLRLLRVYARVESVLYMLAGPDRIKNDYCHPCGPSYLAAADSDNPKGAVLAVAHNAESETSGRYCQRNCHKKGGGRYKGLNILPWLYGRRSGRSAPDTTVEFRMHGNTDDADRVTNWAKLLVTLVEWAHKSDDRAVRALPKSPLRALCAIAPALAPWILDGVKEYRDSTTYKWRQDGWGARVPVGAPHLRHVSIRPVTAAAAA